MIPILYDRLDLYHSQQKPTGVKLRNTQTTWYYRRYLYQKLTSTIEIDGVPDGWNLDYFKWVLFLRGFIAIINTKQFGIVPQICTLHGYDINRLPNKVNINTLVSTSDGGHLVFDYPATGLTIGKDCALIKLSPDYGGAWDIVDKYAELLALCEESAVMNIQNSKLAYVFAAKNKAGAEALKTLFDTIQAGTPAAFLDKELFDDTGAPAWQYFSQNLSQNYIAGQILQDMQMWENKFLTDIGIPNVGISKLSGVTVDEVNANNAATGALVNQWVKTINTGLKVANKLYELNLNARWNYAENFNNKPVQLEQ